MAVIIVVSALVILNRVIIEVGRRSLLPFSGPDRQSSSLGFLQGQLKTEWKLE